MRPRKLHFFVSSLFIVLAAACGDTVDAVGGEHAIPSVPWAVTPFPALPDSVTDVPAARIELGNLLFFDPILSADRETACATCHSEFWGMADGLPLAVGHGAGRLAGPGRDGPNVLRRNASSLFNVAFRASLLWDGRAGSLEDQALLPLEAIDEMNRDPADVVAELRTIDDYVALFAEAFPEDPRVTAEHLASALAAYQRTFISDDALYDSYVAGDELALQGDVLEGMFRFAEKGCDGCHVPPVFESERFFDRHLPGVRGVTDLGREEHTGRREDRGKFRTPTLRNAFSTKPYFHDGSVSGLEDAVRHELEQSGSTFTDRDVTLISRFIDKALRDESTEANRPEELPSGLPTPLDGPTIRREAF